MEGLVTTRGAVGSFFLSDYRLKMGSRKIGVNALSHLRIADHRQGTLATIHETILLHGVHLLLPVGSQMRIGTSSDCDVRLKIGGDKKLTGDLIIVHGIDGFKVNNLFDMAVRITAPSQTDILCDSYRRERPQMDLQ